MPSPHVLIIGGGIGGLALAQGLRKHNIPFTIFERDPTPIARAQGYRIRIASGGAQALYDCLDKELWDLFENSCAEMKFGFVTLNGLDGSEMQTQGPTSGGKMGPREAQDGFRKDSEKSSSSKVKPAYTVDRTIFRSLLLLNQAENVQFGKAFTHYETTSEGVTVFFADGTTASGTLLVGADGVASQVKKQLLPNHRYVDTNLRAIYGKTPINPALEAQFAPEAMKHMTVIKDPAGHLIFLEPIRFPPNFSEAINNRLPKYENYVYWVFGGTTETMGVPDEEFRQFSATEAADHSRKLTADWHSSFQPLFEMQNEEQAAPLRLLCSKPEKTDFSPNSQVTLLGDAAHAMMPASGSGANIALVDAALLVKLLVEKTQNGKAVDEEVMKTYWNGMWEQALPAVVGSAQGAAKLFGFKGFEGTKEVEL